MSLPVSNSNWVYWHQRQWFDKVFSTHQQFRLVNPPPSPLSSSSLSYSLTLLGAEVRPRGHSVSAPSEVTGALGHSRDLPHTPWKVWVCVFLPAPSLRHSDWHVHLELLDEFFSYLFLQQTSYNNANADTHAAKKKASIWLDKQQLTSHIMTNLFLQVNRLPSPLYTGQHICFCYLPFLNLPCLDHIALSLLHHNICMLKWHLTSREFHF